MSSRYLSVALFAATTIGTGTADAETIESTTAEPATASGMAEPTTTATEQPIVVTRTAPHAAPLPPHRGRFSGRRLLLNGLAGAATGSLVAYGVYAAAGGDSVGAAFLGLGANVAVTPLVVYGAGRLQGGEGSLKSAYYGALFGLTAPGTAVAANDKAYYVTLAIGVAIMPFASALFYEASSNIRSRSLEAVATGLSIAPVSGGMRANLSFAF